MLSVNSLDTGQGIGELGVVVNLRHVEKDQNSVPLRRAVSRRINTTFATVSVELLGTLGVLAWILLERMWTCTSTSLEQCVVSVSIFSATLLCLAGISMKLNVTGLMAGS